MFDAVIFDWDGTLADSKKVVVESFQNVLLEMGCKIDNAFIARRIGIGARRTFSEALEACNVDYDSKNLDALVKKKVENQVRLSDAICLFPGAIEILRNLQGKVKIALASMNNRRIVDKLVEEKKLNTYFDVIITADDINCPKPHPEIFLTSVMRLHCTPEKCVVVEDSIFGVKAAKKAKMKCIAVLSGSYSQNELVKEGPDLIVHSVNEQKKILKFILG
ncbi:MAG: HAD family phosphatase [Candidatus Bathyarchaeota archaeon]|jgi:beta-phosphoglucomutase